jgi:hypothetical protein
MLNSPWIGLILNKSADINAAPEKQERKAGSTGDAMDTQRRTGEEGPVPFRSSRFFCVGSKWYFTTREGFDSGPFASRERAETGLKRFLHVVRLLPEEQQLH